MPESDKMDAMLKLIIGSTFCLVVLLIVSLILYSLVFVPQPMNGIAPADKQFFLILSDMSKYILGSLATLLAIKGKEAFVPPGLSTAKERDPTPPAPAPRSEPTLSTPVVTGFAGKPAPPPAHQPEID
jgi:hypothetical protein